MTDEATRGMIAEMLDTDEVCSLAELCLACNVDASRIAELVDHGVVQPIAAAGLPWQFASVSIVRVAKAQRLERDLGLNAAGVAMVLDLVEEIDGLRARLKAFESPAESDDEIML